MLGRRRLTELRRTAAKTDDSPAVAIDRKADNWMLETLAVIVEVGDRIQKRVPHALQMQRPVGITYIEALGDEARRQTLAALTVSLNREDEILTLGPDIRCARHAGRFQTPGHRFNRVVGENAEGRNNVFSEVLVLIVSPDHHEVRLELIDSNSNFLKTVQQGLTVFGCLCFSLVCSPFLLHLPWPVIRVL